MVQLRAGISTVYGPPSHHSPNLPPLSHDPDNSFSMERCSISSRVLAGASPRSAFQEPETTRPPVRAMNVPRQTPDSRSADHVPCMITAPEPFSSCHVPRAALGRRGRACPVHLPRKLCVPAVAIHNPWYMRGLCWDRASTQHTSETTIEPGNLIGEEYQTARPSTYVSKGALLQGSHYPGYLSSPDPSGYAYSK